MTTRLNALALAALLAAGCSGATTGTGGPIDDFVDIDAGTDEDAGPSVDDAGTPDAGDVDAGDVDAGPVVEIKIKTVAPPRGPLAGDIVVVLQGSGFVNGFATEGGPAVSDRTTISFGGNPALDVNVIDDDTIEVRSPAGSRGPADIVLTNPNGSFNCAKCFSFYEAVQASRVTPNQGSVDGGDTITVTGSGFGPGLLVLVGGSEASEVSIAADGRSLTARTPPGAAGSADVVIASPNSSAALRRAFVYVGPVSIDRVEPSSGLVGSDVPVKIFGAGFTADARVELGGVEVSGATFVSDTEIDAKLPAAVVAGPVPVRVVQRRGSALLGDAFVWLDPEERAVAIAGVSPRTGPVAGGTCAQGAATCVRLTGTGFDDPEISVRIGPNEATVHAIDENTLEVDLPPGAAGLVDVQVRGARGSARLEEGFAYVEALAVSKIEPAKGPASGTPPVTATITGEGFSTNCTFLLGANVATVTSVNAAGTEAVVTAPPGSPGVRDVRVTCGEAASPLRREAVLSGAFTFTAPLDVLSVEPDTGAIAGGTLVTIYGSGFGPGVGVTFGRNAAPSVEVKSPNILQVRTPKGNAGAVDVTVSAGFFSNAALRAGFIYVDPTNTLGGASGGAMAGTLNVTIINATQGMSGPVDGVTVSINNDQLVGVSDVRGQVTFSDPALLKPVTVTASKAKFTSVSVARIDARNLTLFMTMNEGDGQPSNPPPGQPPGVFSGRVCGFKLPAGRTLEQYETIEARVYFTAPYVYAAPPFDNLASPAVVVRDCGAYEVAAPRFGPLAIYAEWGIVDHRSAPATFSPILMGIRRGLEASPSKRVENLDIVLDMHRDVDFPVKILQSAPPPGMTVINMVYSYLDLGGEGVLPLAETQSPRSDFVFENHPRVDGDGLLFLNFAASQDNITMDLGYPYSLMFRRQYGDLSAGVEVGPMLAFPVLQTPAPYDPITFQLSNFTGTLAWKFTDGPRPDMLQISVEDATAFPPKLMWDVILPGTEEGVSLPASALQAFPSEAIMQWTVQSARTPRFEYNRFGYQQFYLTSWTAFTIDGSLFQTP